MAKDIAVLVGSLRKDSFNRKMARALAELAPPALKLEVVEIGHLPLYNQDDDANPPAAWTSFRERLNKADAVLFVTPEYNRSIQAPLKNAIDVGSRPYGKSMWNGKPGAIVSVSPGAIGAFGANHHLRQSLVFLNVPAMPQPEAYIVVPTSSSMPKASLRIRRRASSSANSCKLLTPGSSATRDSIKAASAR